MTIVSYYDFDDGWPYHCCHHTHTWYEDQELHSCFYYHRACYIWSREGNEETRRSNSSCERYVLASMLSTSSYSSIYLLIHLASHPSIYSSIYLLIHLSIHPSIYSSIYLLIHLLFIHLSIDPCSIHLSIHPSIYSSIYLLIHLSIFNPSVYSSIYLLTHPSIYPSIYLFIFIHMSIHPSSFLSIYLFIHLPTHPYIYSFI